MTRLRWFLFGAVATLVVALALSILFMRTQGLSAREQPGGAERWHARQARDLALPARAKNQANPVSNTNEVLAEARAHWADHCASCHANDGSGDTGMGKHMYPPAPDMRQPSTQNLSDGELFYVIQNGIRFTGMPGWSRAAAATDVRGSDHDAEDSWKLVRFIRHLSDLTLEERKEMEKLNPKGPEDRKEEEEEEKFLRGEPTNEPQEHHHHH